MYGYIIVYLFIFLLMDRYPGLFQFAAAARSLQSCPTLCDPIDGSRPGSPIPGILQEEHWSGLPFPFPKQEGEK